MKTSIIVIILSMTSQVQGVPATPYFILDFARQARQARQAKGRFQKYKGRNKWKWSVSISSAILW